MLHVQGVLRSRIMDSLIAYSGSSRFKISPIVSDEMLLAAAISSRVRSLPTANSILRPFVCGLSCATTLYLQPTFPHTSPPLPVSPSLAPFVRCRSTDMRGELMRLINDITINRKRKPPQTPLSESLPKMYPGFHISIEQCERELKQRAGR